MYTCSFIIVLLFQQNFVKSLQFWDSGQKSPALLTQFWRGKSLSPQCFSCVPTTIRYAFIHLFFIPTIFNFLHTHGWMENKQTIKHILPIVARQSGSSNVPKVKLQIFVLIREQNKSKPVWSKTEDGSPQLQLPQALVKK